MNLKEQIKEMEQLGLVIDRVIMREDKNYQLGAMEIQFKREEKDK